MSARELLMDPDFVVGIQIEQIIKATNERGRTTTETIADTIDANVQPSSPRERETLAEADRIKESIAVWTLAPIAEDVRIHWSSGAYHVATVEKWTDTDGDYYHAVAVREGVS